MKRMIPFMGILFILVLLWTIPIGCKKGGGMNEESIIKLDSVHMGVRLGMERQEFYDHCWDLNKQGKNITQGHHNTSVLHSDSVNFTYPVDINFYPKFNDENKIYILPVRYEYRSWAPWNKEAHSDKLLPEVVALMEQSYGCKFELKDINGKEVWYNFESPRLVTIYSDDDHFVFVKFKNERYKSNE